MLSIFPQGFFVVILSVFLRVLLWMWQSPFIPHKLIFLSGECDGDNEEKGQGP